jgi:CBS domain-containing protein
VSADLRLGEAAAMMTTYGINHLPVRDHDGDYVGMVSSTDLNETLANA